MTKHKPVGGLGLLNRLLGAPDSSPTNSTKLDLVNRIKQLEQTAKMAAMANYSAERFAPVKWSEMPTEFIPTYDVTANREVNNTRASTSKPTSYNGNQAAFVNDIYNSYYKAVRPGAKSDEDARRQATYLTQKAAFETGYGRSIANTHNYGGHKTSKGWMSFNSMDDFTTRDVALLDKKWSNWRDARNGSEFIDSINTNNGYGQYTPESENINYKGRYLGTTKRVNDYINMGQRRLRCGGRVERPKAWLGALIGAATSIIGGAIQAKAQKKNEEAQRINDALKEGRNSAMNYASMLNNSRDAQEAYLSQFRQSYSKGGRRRLRNGVDITDGGYAVPMGDDTFLLRGSSHDQVNESGKTGIGLKARGTEFEAEGGEVLQKTPSEVRIFSKEPMIPTDSGYIAPADAVRVGGDKEQIFAIQQAINGDYGTKNAKRRLREAGRKNTMYYGDIDTMRNGGRVNPPVGRFEYRPGGDIEIDDETNAAILEAIAKGTPYYNNNDSTFEGRLQQLKEAGPEIALMTLGALPIGKLLSPVAKFMRLVKGSKAAVNAAERIAAGTAKGAKTLKQIKAEEGIGKTAVNVEKATKPYTPTRSAAQKAKINKAEEQAFSPKVQEQLKQEEVAARRAANKPTKAERAAANKAYEEAYSINNSGSKPGERFARDRQRVADRNFRRKATKIGLGVGTPLALGTGYSLYRAGNSEPSYQLGRNVGVDMSNYALPLGGPGMYYDYLNNGTGVTNNLGYYWNEQGEDTDNNVTNINSQINTFVPGVSDVNLGDYYDAKGRPRLRSTQTPEQVARNTNRNITATPYYNFAGYIPQMVGSGLSDDALDAVSRNDSLIPKIVAPTGPFNISGSSTPQTVGSGISSIPRSGIIIDDTMKWQLGAEALGSIGGGITGLVAANSLEDPVAPTPLQASKLPTYYNIRPQLDMIERTRNRYLTDANESSSSVGRLQRRNYINTAMTSASNQAYGEKTNQEIKMLTQDALNQQSVAQQNLANWNAYQDKLTESRNNRRLARASAIQGMISGLGDAVGNFYAQGRQNFTDNRALNAYLAGLSPDARNHFMKIMTATNPSKYKFAV